MQGLLGRLDFWYSIFCHHYLLCHMEKPNLSPLPGRRRFGQVCAIALAFLFASASAEERGIAAEDRILLAEAFRLSDQLGDRIWPGWSAAPFAVLLVTPEFEYLVRHDKPSAEFVAVGFDELLKSTVYRRPRQFPINLQASFPAVNDVPTIVIGQLGNTQSKDATSWVATVMHEHFHQLQMSQPGYFDGVKNLDLAKGDKTGMWMLQFPFPYSDPKVGASVTQLAKALRAPGTTAGEYGRLRQQLGELVKPDEARYAGFQLWQEGLARYTEIRIADWAAANYTPTAGFAARRDYKPFAEHAQALRERVDAQLSQANLVTEKRVLFYAIGAAEGALLDRTMPGWQSRYFAQPFDTKQYFAR